MPGGAAVRRGGVSVSLSRPLALRRGEPIERVVPDARELVRLARLDQVVPQLRAVRGREQDLEAVAALTDDQAGRARGPPRSAAPPRAARSGRSPRTPAIGSCAVTPSSSSSAAASAGLAPDDRPVGSDERGPGAVQRDQRLLDRLRRPAQLERLAVRPVGHPDAASGRPPPQPRSTRSAPARAGRGAWPSPPRGCGRPSPTGSRSSDATIRSREPTARDPRRTAPRTAPASRPARGPATSASQPTSGAPIGVEPRKTIEYSDITRPRMVGSTAICSALFTPAANVTLAAPSGTSASDLQLQRRRRRGQQHRDTERERRAHQQPRRDAPARARGQRARHGADPHRRGQRRVGRGRAVPREVREQRQQDLEVERDRPDQRHHHQRDQQLGRAAHVAQRGRDVAAPARRSASASAAATGPSPAARRTSPGTTARSGRSTTRCRTPRSRCPPPPGRGCARCGRRPSSGRPR